MPRQQLQPASEWDMYIREGFQADPKSELQLFVFKRRSQVAT